MDWVTDLAEIPAKYGVTNVYGELGTSFASSAITHPRHGAAMLGTLIRGLGAEHVLWGTDSVWYGSPQWQIEAFAGSRSRRTCRRRTASRPSAPADGPVKTAILAGNAARLYDVDIEAEVGGIKRDHIAAINAEFAGGGSAPTPVRTRARGLGRSPAAGKEGGSCIPVDRRKFIRDASLVQVAAGALGGGRLSASGRAGREDAAPAGSRPEVELLASCWTICGAATPATDCPEYKFLRLPRSCRGDLARRIQGHGHLACGSLQDPGGTRLARRDEADPGRQRHRPYRAGISCSTGSSRARKKKLPMSKRASCSAPPRHSARGT